MNMMDKMRAKQGLAVTSPKPETMTRPEKDDLPKLLVVFSCGHTVPVSEFSKRKCDGCKNKDQKAKAEKRRGKKPRVERKDSGRLPNGASFVVNYMASHTKWYGVLKIGNQIFEGDASGLFKLLTSLDEQYRKSLEGTHGTDNLSPEMREQAVPKEDEVLPCPD